MKKKTNYLSLGLNSDIFYDGVDRICRCVKETGKKDVYVTAKADELDELKTKMRQTMHFKQCMEDVKEESILLRNRMAGLKRQIVWWSKFGSVDEKAHAQRLMAIVNPYGALNHLVLRACRTTADLIVRDLSTESAMADIAALSGMSNLVDQVSDSLEVLRQKQDAVDAIKSDWEKPASLLELRRSITVRVNAVMDYIAGNADANPEAFAKLLNNLETILVNANHRNIAVQAAAEAAPAITPAE